MTEGLRVLIVTPSYLPEVTGNSITAQRLNNGLTEKGLDVRVVMAAHCNVPSQFQPDIIHALHALKGGVPAMEKAAIPGVPFIVTLTGTDLNVDLMQHRSSGVTAVLDKAARIIVYGELAREQLVAKCSFCKEKIAVIRPSVDIGRPKGRQEVPQGLNFLLPSGIRRVKDPLFAIRPLQRLRNEFPSTNLVIAGPVLDEAEWERLSEITAGKEWISYRKVSHDEMPDLYQASDIILNTSISEGLSNAVLEGMYFGKPVLASDCDGNRSVVTDGAEGLLYRQGDEADFMQKAKTLVLYPEMRERLGRAGIDKVARDYSLASEMEGHLMLYGDVLGRTVKRIKRK